MSSTNLSDGEIIQHLVKRGAITQIAREYNLHDLYASSAQNQQNSSAPKKLTKQKNETATKKSETNKLEAQDKPLKDNDNKEDERELQEKQKRDQSKLVRKIWTATRKLVRSQANKGRIVDSLFFGSFMKANLVTAGKNSGAQFDVTDHYVYCPGPASQFRLVENAENCSKIPQRLINDKLVAISLQAIAEVCACKVEVVQAVLSLLRDEVLDLTLVKKQKVKLNFLIGSLVLNEQGMVQFCSLKVSEVIAAIKNGHQVGNVRLTSENLKGLASRKNTDEDIQTRDGVEQHAGGVNQSVMSAQSITERSLHYMQARQSQKRAEGNNSRMSKRSGSQINNGSQLRTSQDLFANQTKSGQNDVNTNEYLSEQNGAPYFQKRLQSQQRLKQAGKNQRYSLNSRSELRNSKQPMTSGSNPNPNQTVDHTHLNQFLRDQITAVRDTKSKSSRRTSTTQSQSSYQLTRGKTNALIERAAQVCHNHQLDGKESSAGAGRETATDFKKLQESLQRRLVQRSNYHENPLAATLNSRPFGHNKTKSASVADQFANAILVNQSLKYDLQPQNQQFHPLDPTQFHTQPPTTADDYLDSSKPINGQRLSGSPVMERKNNSYPPKVTAANLASVSQSQTFNKMTPIKTTSKHSKNNNYQHRPTMSAQEAMVSRSQQFGGGSSGFKSLKKGLTHLQMQKQLKELQTGEIDPVYNVDQGLKPFYLNAFQRKQIGSDYQTTMPTFLQAQGPFAVYDHATHKGKNVDKIAQKIKDQALDRLSQEISSLKQTRMQEKSNFYQNLQSMNQQEAKKVQLMHENRRRNQEYIQSQIELNSMKKRAQKSNERAYAKPHFGPEDDESKISMIESETQQKKNDMREKLELQIRQQKDLSEASKAQELALDQQMISAANDLCHLEELALKKKKQAMQQNLTEAWQKQVELRRLKETTDKLFK